MNERRGEMFESIEDTATSIAAASPLGPALESKDDCSPNRSALSVLVPAVLRQGRAAAQCYNAENVLEDGTYPWLALMPDEHMNIQTDQHNWFVLDLMGLHTLDSFELKSCTGEGWMLGEVKLQGCISAVEPIEWHDLASFSLTSEEHSFELDPSAQMLKVAFVKVICTSSCIGDAAAHYMEADENEEEPEIEFTDLAARVTRALTSSYNRALSSPNQQREREFEVWGGLLTFKLLGRKILADSEFRIYLHMESAVIRMPKVDAEELYNLKWPCACSLCTKDGETFTGRIDWTRTPRLDIRPGDLTLHAILGQMLICQLRKIGVDLIASATKNMPLEQELMSSGLGGKSLDNIDLRKMSPKNPYRQGDQAVLDIDSLKIRRRRLKPSDSDASSGLYTESLVQLKTSKCLKIVLTRSEMQQVIVSTMDEGKLCLKYDERFINQVYEIREVQQRSSQAALLASSSHLTSSEVSLKKMRADIQAGFTRRFKDAQDFARSLNGRADHWVFGMRFVVNHPIDLVYKSPSWPPLEAVFMPKISILLNPQGPVVGIDFHGVKIWFPSRKACPSAEKCQFLASWAVEQLETEHAAPIPDLHTIKRLEIFRDVFSSYSCRLQGRFPACGDDDEASLPGQLIFAPFEGKGMLSTTILRLHIENTLGGNLLDFQGLRLMLEPAGMQLYLGAVNVSSTIADHEVDCWCAITVPFSHPLMDYGDRLTLDFTGVGIQSDWTVDAVRHISDGLSGFGCMFPSAKYEPTQTSQETDPDPDQPEWLVIRGLDQCLVRLTNTYPTLGMFNITKMSVLPTCVLSELEPNREGMRFKITAALWFLLSLDLVPVYFALGVFMMINTSCSEISDNTDLCIAQQWVIYTLGIATLVWGVFLMPLVLSCWQRQATKQFCLIANFLAAISIGFSNSGGAADHWNPTTTIGVLRTIGICLFVTNAVVPLVMEASLRMRGTADADTVPSLNYPIHASMFYSRIVLNLIAVWIGMMGMCQLLLIQYEDNDRDYTLCKNLSDFEDSGGDYILWSGGAKIIYMVLFTIVMTLDHSLRDSRLPDWDSPLINLNKRMLPLIGLLLKVLISIYCIADLSLGIIIFIKVTNYHPNGAFDKTIGCRTYEVARQVILYWMFALAWSVMLFIGHWWVAGIRRGRRRTEKTKFVRSMRSQFALTDQIMRQSGNRFVADVDDRMPDRKPREGDGIDEELKEQWRVWIRTYYPVGLSYDLNDDRYLHELISYLSEQNTHLQQNDDLFYDAENEDEFPSDDLFVNELLDEVQSGALNRTGAEIKLDPLHNQPVGASHSYKHAIEERNPELFNSCVANGTKHNHDCHDGRDHDSDSENWDYRA